MNSMLDKLISSLRPSLKQTKKISEIHNSVCDRCKLKDMRIEISEIPKEWSAAFKNCHKKFALKEAETLKLLPHVLHACPGQNG